MGKERQIPNPQSDLLAHATVGEAGTTLSDKDLPYGMAAILLYMPLEKMTGKSVDELRGEFAHAIIGGAGMGTPPEKVIPKGMGVIVLHVPFEKISGKSLPELQNDLGLPWFSSDEEGNNATGIWFDEL